ncbi:rho GDP-dissociation inhibitor 1-like [Zingiber officinale]|uniref:rho GDP-dissociation inhibitor 1-like n=1 Tax=Zingiber officinale TaxID=94328 RepID=UPI001C4B23A7|nr:rho GDP-dissociation inhibitor 1-like [Zingiber officinale]
MYSAIGALPCSNAMALEQKSEKCEKNGILTATENEREMTEGEVKMQLNKASLRDPEEEEVEEEEDDDEKAVTGVDLGPQVSLKDQMEKDKEDESLRKWKEQLLGSVDLNAVGGEILEPEVKILSLSIISPGRPHIVLPLLASPDYRGVWFTLKEGSHYRLKFNFSVSNNIVSGLRYTNTVWKTGIKVDRTKEMLGTFSPQVEPYTYETPEEITPCGIFARGTYSARTKFVDDDGKCYLEINYTFDIRREWLPIS